MSRGSMLVCAVVGLLLLVIGALAPPNPWAAGQTSSGAAAAPTVAPPTAEASPPVSTSPSATGSGSTSPTAGVDTQETLVPDTGPGTYATASVSAPTSDSSGRLYRFDVRVEDGLDLDPDTVARAMEKTLDDKRSWRGIAPVRFSLVPSGQSADLHAYLVTPGTTDKLCYPLLTGGEVSCRAGDKVVLNAKRWVFGAGPYGTSAADVADYREYLVNHEFGHALGHGHVGCPATGRPAPVMLQQTKGLQGCTANPWPSRTKG